MLLFFVVSLVAAYAGRNLIFEQKTSANQYRATQAFEAAEAGLEWALAMLNGGRIDATCTPPDPVNNALPSFRQRYLNIDVDGRYAPRLWADNLTRERPAACKATPAGTAVAPRHGTDPGDPGRHGTRPAFRVVRGGGSAAARRGARRLHRPHSFVDQPCEDVGEGTAGDAAATVERGRRVEQRAASPPMAALTVVGNLTNSAALTLVNTDPQANGLTANLGEAAPEGGRLSRARTAGLVRQPLDVDRRPSSGSVPAATVHVGVSHAPGHFKRQPAAVVLDGCAAPCSDELRQAVLGNPDRIVWVNGNLALSTQLDLDNVDPPALIVATGNVSISASGEEFAACSSVWATSTNSAPDTRIHGARRSPQSTSANSGSGTTIEFDSAVVKQLRLASGSLVRVPGSWRDFP